jgi:uncharacterized protein (TIGR03066 family)
MSWLRSTLLASLAAGLLAASAPAALGDDKDKDKAINKDKLVGTWEIVKSTAADSVPPGTLVEFTKDGKLNITVEADGKKITLKGSYSLEGNTLKTKITGPDGQEQSDSDTITKLTDKEMSLKDKKDQRTELKKK